MAGELKRYPADTTTFISLHHRLVPMWNQQKGIWLEVIQKLPIQKYAHSRHSEHADKMTVKMLTTTRGQKADCWFGIYKKYMPLPTTTMIYPELR